MTLKASRCNAVARYTSAAVMAALICAVAVGCDASSPGPGPDGESGPPVTTTTSAQAAPPAGPTEETGMDYGRLLLQPGDLSDQEDSFTVRSTASPRDDMPGASALFVNQDDTRAISDTIVIYPDAETAARTLREALPTIDTLVAGAAPRPVPVGADGTIAVGTSPDGTKATTLLLFTEGPALVRLEFQSVPGDATTDEFVVNIGKMQQIALRTGLDQPK